MSLATLLVTAAAAPPASAPTSPPGASRAPSARPSPPDPTVIGMVDGIPIRQAEWDRLATPYFKEVETRAGRKLTEDEMRLLRKNLLEELIRERLWLADARRRGMKVSDDAIDARMKASDFFKVGDKVDEGKFLAFKRSPTSNYAALRVQVGMGLQLEDYSRWMERRFSPREAEVMKTYQERTAEAVIRYFVMGPEAVSLEPEAGAKQIRAFYEAHQQDFQTPDSARIQYVRLAIETAGSDSTREAAAPAALKAANDLIAAIQSGAPVETAAKVYGGLRDTGWFRIADPIRGLGRSDPLQDAIRATAADTWVKTPIRIGPYYVVVRVVDKKPSRLQSFREVAPLAKRGADQLVRRGLADSLGREELRLHPQTYAVPRLAATIVARATGEIDSGAAPTPKEIEKALEKRRKAAKIKPANRAWIDSVSSVLPSEIRQERRNEAIQRAFRETVSRLKSGEDGPRIANEAGGVAEAFDLYRGQPIELPMLAEGAFLDSLYAFRPGAVVGPRIARDSVFVVRIDRIDPAFVPPYEAVRQAASTNAQMVKRFAEEQDAKRYYEAHKDEFKTKPEWIFDYVYFKKAHPDSVAAPESLLVTYYREHPLEFTVPASAKARVILFEYRPGDGADAREKARQRALAARRRIVAGEDFAAVARETSDDKQSAEQGGVIPRVTRSQVPPELAEVIFSAPLGQVSEVVEARTAFHVIRVDERTDEKLRPFAEVRAEIRTVVGEPIADSLAFTAATNFATRAAAGNFDSLAATVGGATRSKPTQAGAELPGIGPFENVPGAMSPLADGQVTPEPVPIGQGYLVARRVREVEPAPAPFEEVKERAILTDQIARRKAAADSVDQTIREAVARGADVEPLFEGFGGMRTSHPFPRPGPIAEFARDAGLARDSTLLDHIFASRPGKVLPPIKSSLGTVYIIVDSVTAPPASDFARRRDEMWREIVDQRIEAWTARLRSRAQVTLFRKDLKSLLATS